MIDAHRGAFEYDWRARFGLPLTSVGRSMAWGEAIRLTKILAGDPSSQVAASIAGWTHAASRESLVLMDLFDLTHAANSDKKHRPKPYPRPWPAKGRTKTKPAASLTQAEIIAALRFAGHTAPLPAGVGGGSGG